MAAGHYYLLASLPHLGELGSVPPLSARALLTRLAESGGPCDVAEALFLSDDLLQRDSVQAAETEEAEAAVLSPEQLRDDEPLPPYLAAAEDQPSGRIAADRVWDAYFRHADRVGRSGRCSFLTAWVGHEVGLRNALAAARAKALDLDAEEYLVAADLGAGDVDFGPVVNEWSAASDPLSGLRAIDWARWQWLNEHENWFSFGDDEVAVYAVRLMLLQRRLRLDQAEETDGKE